MNKLVLYCKSYSKDADRFKILCESIVKYNKDNIPFVVCVPREDDVLFGDILSKTNLTNASITWDEIVLEENINQSWKHQQLSKILIWKKLDSENYVVLDSDSYFIKNFYEKDFLVHDDIPYTVIHEQKDLFQWTSKNKNILGFDPQISFAECRQPIQDLFDRKGKLYDFGPIPVIWSSKVWQTFEDEYIKPNNLTFKSIIDNIPSEFSWYGEWLLIRKPIELWPIEPIFKVFHYLPQYYEYKNQGYTEEHWAQNYLGICMQSSSGLPLKY